MDSRDHDPPRHGAADDDAVATIHDRLKPTRVSSAQALSWDLDTHAVSVTFQVEAEHFIGAVIRAAGAMTDAIGRPDHAADFQLQPGDVPVA